MDPGVHGGLYRQMVDAAHDEQAFQRMVEPHVRGLRAHSYRMLGSAEDADDAVQETLLRAWRALDSFEGRSSLRSWLYRIATNTCLTTIERRPKRVLRLDDPEEPDMEWIEPFPDDAETPATRYDQRESLELAFVAAIQHLPARQRAVLILRDVLGFSGAEVAEMLETEPSSVYSLLQRAHRAVDERIPDASQQQTLRGIGDARLRAVAESWVEAWERNDVHALAGLLTDDALMTMPPLPQWFRGRDAVREFIAGGPLAPGMRWRFRPARANGQMAFAAYGWDSASESFLPHALQVLTLAPDGRVSELTSFLGDDFAARFGLPPSL